MAIERGGMTTAWQPAPLVHPPTRRLHVLVCGVLCLLAAITFYNVVAGEFFAFDDDVEIFVNEHIRSFSAENVRWMVTDTALTQRYTPLSWVAWAVVYQVGGLNPAAYHVHALIVHVITTALVYFLLVALLRRMHVWKEGDAWMAVWAGIA